MGIIILVNKENDNMIQIAALVITIIQLIVTLALFLFAYAYTVKTNIRSAIEEIPPIETENYSISPVVYGVKWRLIPPKTLPRRGLSYVLRIAGQSGRKRTILNFIVYDRHGGTEVPVPPETVADAVQEMFGENLDNVSHENVREVFEKVIENEYGVNSLTEQPLSKNKSGIKIHLETTSPDKLQNITIAFLHICKKSIQSTE